MPNMLEADGLTIVSVAYKGSKRHAKAFLKRKPMKTASRKKSSANRRIKPKKHKIDLWREWNVPDKAYHRYSGLKGVYWYWFSRTVRERDYKEHAGLCMTCLTYVEKGDDQGGHLFAASKCGFALLFHPKNVHLQHSKCNNPRITPQAGVLNAIHIDQRYGAGTVELLAKLKEMKVKEWSKAEYEEKIRALPAYRESLAC